MPSSVNHIYTGPLKAVILDWAGTILDYGCMAPTAVFQAAFAEFGVDITVAEAREPMGMSKIDHIRTISQMERVAAAWQDEHGRLPTEADVEAMFASFEPRQVEVAANYATLIPGALDAIAAFRKRDLKIGTCTGYTRPIMEAVLPLAAEQGFEPDCVVAGNEVPASRPAPWMALQNAMQFNIYPMAAVVKVGDTVADILEGRNASMWSIGVAKSGNEMGLSYEEIQALPEAELQAKLDHAYAKLRDAGAHYVVDSLADVPALLDKIEARLEQGEQP